MTKTREKERERKKRDSLPAPALLHDALDVVPPTVTAWSTLDDVAAHLASPARDTGSRRPPLGDLWGAIEVGRRRRPLLGRSTRRRRCGRRRLTGRCAGRTGGAGG